MLCCPHTQWEYLATSNLWPSMFFMSFPKENCKNSVYIKRWRSQDVDITDLLVTTDQDVRTTAASSAVAANTTSGSMTACCAISKVTSSDEMFLASYSLALASQDSHVFLGANITLPLLTLDSVSVIGKLRLAAVPGYPYNTYFSSGFFNEVGRLNITLQHSRVTCIQGFASLLPHAHPQANTNGAAFEVHCGTSSAIHPHQPIPTLCLLPPCRVNGGHKAHHPVSCLSPCGSLHWH